MRAATENKTTHEEEYKQMDTLEPDEMLQYHLDSIRALTETCDKTSTLDLKNFNLSELTATLFSTDSDQIDTSSSEFNTLGSDTVEYKRSNLESILDPDQVGVSSPEGEVQLKLDGPGGTTLKSLSTPHDVISDLDQFLDAACDSQYSTLNIPSTPSLAGSQYSTLETPTSSGGGSPQHRIVSQPSIPSVDSLSHITFEISDQISDHVTDHVTDRESPDRTDHGDPGSMTYVSSFSLNTWDKGDGEDVVENIKSETPASYDDCSLKLVQPTALLYGGDSNTYTIETTPSPDENRQVTTDLVVGEDSVGDHVVGEDGVGDHVVGEDGVRDHVVGEDGVGDHVVGEDSVGDHVIGEDGLRGHVVGEDGVGDHVVGEDSVGDHVDVDGDHVVEDPIEGIGRVVREPAVKDPAVTVGALVSDGAGNYGAGDGDEVQDSGFDSLESSTASAAQPAKSTAGSRGMKRCGTSDKDTMSSTGGTQCSGSGNSLEDVSCPSSPVMSDSSEQSPHNIISSSLSSLPDVPAHAVRSRSAASNVSDHVLTTLDRPRTQSFAGTPIRQAWLQVCCYERDAQTGNFLIDKHKVQVDGHYLHPELNNDPELYRISLPGLVNDDRLPKTDKMLPEIGDGVVISRDRATGDVTLTKLCRKDVYMMNESFLALKEDEKCKGKHEKLEQNTTYTIFNKQQFVDDVRNSAIDLTKIHTIGQVAIAFIKINGNSMKGVPCWIKVQCLEAMNLLKNLLAGSTPKEREWLRRQPSTECPESPRRTSMARLSFGKSLSKSSLKDSKSSVNSSDSGSTPIPRSKSKSQLFRSRKKGLSQSNGASPEPRSNRNSGTSQHLEPFTLNYECPEGGEEPPSQQLRDSELFRSRRISSPPNNLTSADVSLPLHRASSSVPTT